MSGGVHNVTVTNCTAQYTNAGPRVKTARGRGGVVSNVTYSQLDLTDLPIGISFDMFYNSDPPTNTTGTPVFRDISIINVTGSSLQTAGQFKCLPESPCENITLDKVKLVAKK